MDAAADYLHNPGISVLAPALAAARAGLVTAMHDPTEGGVITGLRELATASQVGLSVDLTAIAVPTLAADLCAAFDLDPLGTIASGALLATCAPDNVAALRQCWSAQDWPSCVIGTITSAADGLHAVREGVETLFPDFVTDEITKLFA